MVLQTRRAVPRFPIFRAGLSKHPAPYQTHQTQNNLPMRLTLPPLLLGPALALAALSTILSSGPAADVPPLKMTAVILSQKYCRNDEKTYTAIIHVRMSFLNQTNRKLIVEKSAGLGEYSIFVARDAKSLSDRNYEYSLNVDRTFEWLSSKEPEDPNTLGKRFAILAPGESRQIESEFWMYQVGRQRDGDELPHTLRSGVHTMKIYVESGTYYPGSEELRKRWEPFGDLIFANVMSEPFDFSLPADPKIEKCN